MAWQISIVKNQVRCGLRRPRWARYDFGSVSFYWWSQARCAPEKYLMSFMRQCSLFALILIAALLSAVVRLVSVVKLPRLASIPSTRTNESVGSVAREEVPMPTRARTAFDAAIDGAALGLATVAAVLLVLWWIFRV
jgi:hypothetical protein